MRNATGGRWGADDAVGAEEAAGLQFVGGIGAKTRYGRQR